MTNKHIRYYIIVFLLIFLGGCKTNYILVPEKTTGKVTVLDTVNVPVSDSLTLEIIKPYKARIDSQMNEIIAYSETNMQKDLPEGKLNNFIADLIYLKGNQYLQKSYQKTADICLLNYGGLRTSLPKGALTVGNIYELMPFENELVALEISSDNFKKLLQYIAQKGGMPQSGIVMGILNNELGKVRIQGKEVNLNTNYIVITSDYLAGGGDEMSFFSNPVSYFPLGIKVRDAIIEYLKEVSATGNTVNTKLDKRIYYE